jgi:hypothetical protein
MPQLHRLAALSLSFALAPLGASTASAHPAGPGLTGPVRLTATGAVELPLWAGGAGTFAVTGAVPRGSATISALGRGPDGITRRISVPRDYRRVTGHVALRTRHAGRVRLSVPVATGARGELMLRIHFSRARYQLYTVVRLARH